MFVQTFLVLFAKSLTHFSGLQFTGMDGIQHAFSEVSLMLYTKGKKKKDEDVKQQLLLKTVVIKGHGKL